MKKNVPRMVAPYHADVISPMVTSPTIDAVEAIKCCKPWLGSLPLIATTRVEGTTRE